MARSAVDKILFERPAFVLTVLLVWILVILYFVHPFTTRHQFVTLHKILKNGELTVITKNNAHCYYLYRDEPMGFEYEVKVNYNPISLPITQYVKSYPYSCIKF